MVECPICFNETDYRITLEYGLRFIGIVYSNGLVVITLVLYVERNVHIF